jgi:hypothetical protein
VVVVTEGSQNQPTPPPTSVGASAALQHSLQAVGQYGVAGPPAPQPPQPSANVGGAGTTYVGVPIAQGTVQVYKPPPPPPTTTTQASSTTSSQNQSTGQQSQVQQQTVPGQPSQQVAAVVLSIPGSNPSSPGATTFTFTVKDANGPLQGALITLICGQLSYPVSGTTDYQGNVSIPVQNDLLPVTAYGVSLGGYQNVWVTQSPGPVTYVNMTPLATAQPATTPTTQATATSNAPAQSGGMNWGLIVAAILAFLVLLGIAAALSKDKKKHHSRRRPRGHGRREQRRR